MYIILHGFYIFLSLLKLTEMRILFETSPSRIEPVMFMYKLFCYLDNISTSISIYLGCAENYMIL